MKSPAKKSTVTRIPNRQARGMSTAEWDARCELAAAYRLANTLGWSDFLGTHFSLRVPGTKDEFLLNPYGMLFEEMTASALIKVDTEGNKLSESPYEVNRAGFVIHSAVHMGAPEAHCVMHCHTVAGVGVSSQKRGLLPITQMALTAWSEIRYHDYEGVADNEDERERIVKDLGDGTMLILRNHGTLTVGSTVGEAFARMNRIERACRFQIAAQAGGAEANPIPEEVVNYTAQQGRELAKTGRGAGGKLLWAALMRKLDREDPGYRQ
ncbi:MAG TPA: class II aldolase/adducin family protein [Burkholderiales bacterium]|nr:class II aldolase/adducin family protein [Burkholderiales bacterium]